MFLDHLPTRRRLLIVLAVGAVAALLVPGVDRWVTRGLVGWNAAVWLFLALDAAMMRSADQADLRRLARANAEDIRAVLLAVVAAALASLAAIVLELAAAKSPHGGHAAAQVGFTLATVTGSWLLVAVLFTLNYASLYYRDAADGEPGRGLRFPDDDPAAFRPDYVDFLYFSFTIAVAVQTSDVEVTTRAMRKLVLMQSVLGFAFNTLVLALTINIAAGLF